MNTFDNLLRVFDTLPCIQLLPHSVLSCTLQREIDKDITRLGIPSFSHLLAKYRVIQEQTGFQHASI